MLKNTVKKRTALLLGCILSCGLAFAQGGAIDVSTQKAQTPKVMTAQLAQAPAGVNINTASAAELADALSGVGLTKAEAIVAFRELNGSFLELDEIAQVKGIGGATLEKNKVVIRFQ